MVDAKDCRPPARSFFLTDSFNDEPQVTTDAAYPGLSSLLYARRTANQVPKARPRNSDYERLLKKLLASGKLTQFGIGIKIAGQWSPDRTAAAVADYARTCTPPTMRERTTTRSTPQYRPAKPASPATLPRWSERILAVLAGIAAFVLRTTAAGVGRAHRGRPRRHERLLRSRTAAAIRVGRRWRVRRVRRLPDSRRCERAGCPRVRGVAWAIICRSRTARKGNQSAPPRVYHNGLPLEKEEPLNYGDEVRVGLPSIRHRRVQRVPP